MVSTCFSYVSQNLIYVEGNVVYVKVLGQNIIFVNSAKAAYELFEKKSAICSDRPRLPLLREL